MIINKTAIGTPPGYASINRLQQRIEELQVQLGTGQRTQTLSGLGSQRMFDIALRARLSGIEAYQHNVTTATLRLDLMDTAVSRLDTLEAEARTSASPGGYGTGNINMINLPVLSKTRLDEVLSLLNTDVAGRYLFAGGKTDTRPVAGVNAILDGEAGRAGFRTISGERLLADRGADDLGRLTLGRTGAVVDLAEDGAHPFGYKLSTLSTDSTAITLTAPAGAPAALAVEFTGQPVAGQRVTLGLTLPDGTEAGITMVAVTGTPTKAGEFQIAATPDDTAANFEASLSGALAGLTGSKLVVASSFAAADNFFNGQGQQVMRVDGPPFESATALVVADPNTTVTWYRGEDSASARDTVKVKVDDGTAARYGVQANEFGFLQLVRSLAVSSTQNFSAADATARDRFDAVARGQSDRLAESENNAVGSIEAVTMELGIARSVIGAASERHDAYAYQLETRLAGIENVNPEEVASELLALKVRLEASYMTMSMVSQLSLVNYLG